MAETILMDEYPVTGVQIVECGRKIDDEKKRDKTRKRRSD